MNINIIVKQQKKEWQSTLPFLKVKAYGIYLHCSIGLPQVFLIIVFNMKDIWYETFVSVSLLLQIEVAMKYIDYHMTEFGYASPNVAFIEGLIEDILDLGIKRDSMDIIM